jgi:hypothetical protein
MRSDEFGPLPLLAMRPLFVSVSVSGIKLKLSVVEAIGISELNVPLLQPEQLLFWLPAENKTELSWLT